MPRAKANKLYRTFTKGLITEAGYLTYPENASIDELNTVIKVKGSRSRRLGMDYEPDSVSDLPDGFNAQSVVAEFAWKGVGNDASLNFLVVQAGHNIYFYDLDAVPVDGSRKTFSVDLSDYLSPTGTAALVDQTPSQMTAGKGWLFVVNQYVEPIIIEYDATTDTVSVLKLIISIRDFEGVDDSLGNEDQPTTLTPEHLYNLRNQGWVKPGYSNIGTAPTAGDPYTPPAGPTTTTPRYIDAWNGEFQTVIE